MGRNLHELRKEIINMTPRQNIYMVLKEELTKLGYWRNHPRGNPSAGYKAQQTKTTGEESTTYEEFNE